MTRIVGEAQGLLASMKAIMEGLGPMAFGIGMSCFEGSQIPGAPWLLGSICMCRPPAIRSRSPPPPLSPSRPHLPAEPHRLLCEAADLRTQPDLRTPTDVRTRPFPTLSAVCAIGASAWACAFASRACARSFSARRCLQRRTGTRRWDVSPQSVRSYPLPTWTTATRPTRQSLRRQSEHVPLITLDYPRLIDSY